tara:strand:- start:566 stop:1531 length:966 start_codon:yes stop_codon:yes gene_type:complete
MKIDPYKHIKPELEELEVVLQKSIYSDVKLATEVSSYIVKSGGKRIRPALNILLAKSLSYKGSELLNLAAAIELLHTATLIHDDVVDESDIRRGKESIHRKWNNAHGVLVGDFVYSKAFQLMASLSNKRIIQSLADSTNRISEGEVLQLNLLNSKTLKEKDYFEIIGRKTAELFKASTATAAHLAGSNNKMVLIAANFGFSLGIAFQLKDDLLDYSGEETYTGKQKGKDFMEGKITLPLIHALDKAQKKEKEFLMNAFRKGNKEDLNEVINFFNESGAIEKVQEEVENYSDKCLFLLEKLDNSKYKESLISMVNTLKKRSN